MIVEGESGFLLGERDQQCFIVSSVCGDDAHNIPWLSLIA